MRNEYEAHRALLERATRQATPLPPLTSTARSSDRLSPSRHAIRHASMRPSTLRSNPSPPPLASTLLACALGLAFALLLFFSLSA
jgi:hypothetical protein